MNAALPSQYLKALIIHKIDFAIYWMNRHSSHFITKLMTIRGTRGSPQMIDLIILVLYILRIFASTNFGVQYNITNLSESWVVIITLFSIFLVILYSKRKKDTNIEF